MKILKCFIVLLLMSSGLFSQSWMVQSNPGTGNIIAIQAFDTNLVYALTGTQVLKTTNGGTNWNIVFTAPPSRTFKNWQWDQPNVGNLWFTNWNQKFKTTDGGFNWTPYILPGVPNDMQYLNDTNNIYFIDNSQSFLYTTNSGSNWYSSSVSGFTINSLGSMYFVNQQTGFVNGGTSWTYLHRLLRTTDRGFTWTTNMASNTNGYEGGGDFKFFGNIGFHVSNRTYKTTNMGENWVILNNQSGGRNSLFMHDPQWGWLGKSDGLLKTTDGCSTWVNQNIGISGVSIYEVSFINYNTGWICGSSGHILKTTNGSGVTPPAQAPTLTSPPNNSTGQSITPLLQWNSVPNAVNYRVQVSIDVFNSTVLDYDTVSVTQLQVPPGFLNNNVLYYWRVTALNIGGQGPWSVVWNFRTGLVGINQTGNEIPSVYKLYNNYPNPFNPVTKIKFDIPQQSFTKLIIYDISGKEVSMLVNEQLNPGSYEADFDASKLPSGVYFYKISSGGYAQVKKMILVK
ncbi:MAG: T9SS type A sorting domain-containing protein [Ignavibacteria bacterium]|nr:T9SS type A sorting domain-containing protein [Ignavibacteria bacterium]